MTQAVTLAQLGGADTTLPFRNRIINGSMTIDQRNAGALYTTNGGGDYTVDRWAAKNTNTSGVFQTQQNLNSVTPPAGFNYYLGVKPSTSASTTSADCWYMQQLIEGYNVNDLAWGTASAKSITISFWVYSSVTGIYGGFLANNAANRCYVYSYTINSANTWEYKTITIPGDTSGSWTQSNGVGLFVTFCFGAGSNYTTTANTWGGTLYRAPTGQVSIMGSTSNVFYFTGVQLEVGTVATPFERRPFGMELTLCQRYYEKSFAQGTAPAYNQAFNFTTGTVYVGTSISIPIIPFKVTKRAAPTMTFYGVSTSGWKYYAGGFSSLSSFSGTAQDSYFYAEGSGTSGLSQYQSTIIGGNWTAEIEL